MIKKFIITGMLCLVATSMNAQKSLKIDLSSKSETTVSPIVKEKVQFIKIDIDGPDLLALKSCTNIINSFKPKIIIELSEDSFRCHGMPYSEVIDFLNKKNYQCYEILKIPKLFDRKLTKNEVINIFAK